MLADVSENIIDEERKLEDDFAKEARLESCRIHDSIDMLDILTAGIQCSLTCGGGPGWCRPSRPG